MEHSSFGIADIILKKNKDRGLILLNSGIYYKVNQDSVILGRKNDLSVLKNMQTSKSKHRPYILHKKINWKKIKRKRIVNLNMSHKPEIS